MNGPRARVEARLYDLPLLGNDSRIVAGAQYEYDDVRGSSSVGFLNVRIPLGPGGCRGCRPKMNLLDRRMVTPIVRDIDIVTNVAQAGPTDIAMNVVTGTVLDDVVRLTSADDLLAEIEGGPENRTFILDGVDGGATLTSDIDLNDGQILIGGGGSMRVVGVNSGMNAIFTAKGAPFSIEQTNGAQSVISLASNNGVYGLTTMGGLNSITGAQTGNFEIAGNSLMGATGSSIALFPVTGMTTGFITDNMLSGNSGDAIGVLASVDPMVDLTIARNSFDMIGGNGVNITSLLNSNVTAKIDDNTFNGVEDNAVNMSAINNTVSNIEITNNQINGNATTDDGVNIFLGNNAMMDLVIDNNVIDDVNDDAVQIDSDDVLFVFGSNAVLNATITNNTILGRGNTSDGIDILVSDDTVLTGTIANNIFDSVTSDAFELDANDDAVIDLSIVSNMFRGQGVTSDGIDISIEDDNQLTLLVDDNRFEDFTQVAMGIESINDATTNLNFTNNTILGSGMTVDGIVLDYSDDSELTGTIGNNIIRDVATSSIFIDGADDADFDLSILDNDIRNTQFGIDIFTNSGDDDNSFIIGGNKLKGISGTGIFLFANGTTTLGDNGQDNSVSVEMGGSEFEIDTDGDVIGTIKINGVDEVFP